MLGSDRIQAFFSTGFYLANSNGAAVVNPHDISHTFGVFRLFSSFGQEAFPPGTLSQADIAWVEPTVHIFNTVEYTLDSFSRIFLLST
jgi:hypothetical protein